MILAADVGGSKTLVGLFAHAPRRPRPIDVRSVATLAHDGLPRILHAFLDAHRDVAIDVASLGVAGPIVDGEVTLTNVPWRVRTSDIVQATGVPRVQLLNDLEAMAHAVPVLEPAELHTLQAGRPDPTGNAALIAAGTGLGEAILHRIGERLLPVPSEAGHADFAARTDVELDLVRHLRNDIGRVDIERVVSGLGLVHIARYLHGGNRCPAAGDFAAEGSAARVSAAADSQSCTQCVAVLDLFVDAYGAEAGNLALRAVATAGLFVGGGIAPKILPLVERRFITAFTDKAPMRDLLLRVPVHVILNDEAALLGAATSVNSPAAS